MTGRSDSAPVTSTIDVTAVDDAPVLTAGATLNYTENQAATAIDGTITVTDADNANLASATAQITAGYQNGADVLDCPGGCGGLSASFVAGTGTLTLSGSATLAVYQAALRTVSYVNTSNDPNTAARTVTWIGNDGTAASTGVTSSIAVTAVNDPPVVTAGATLNYTENQAATAIDATITVTDPDNANLASATAQITAGYQNGSDALNCPAGCGGLTSTFTPATGTLSLSGSATVAAYQAALRSVTFANTSEDPNTAMRTVTWIGNDGAAASTPVTSTVNVTAVNDPPVLTAGATLNYTENQAATPIDGTITVVDPDNGTLASATVQITAGYQDGADLLDCPTGCGGLTAIFTPATGTLSLSGSASLAAYQALLNSVTYVNTSDDPNTATRTVTWIGNDGVVASTPVTSTIHVTAVNDAPVLTAGGTLSYTENDPATAIDTGVVATDPDSNIASATVQITANYQNGFDLLSFSNTGTITGVFVPVSGTLTLTGSDTPANWQAALRTVKYSNTSNNPTTMSRTVTWIASDGAASSTPATSTINVTAVNDPPTLTAGAMLSYTENQAATAIDTTVTVVDPDSSIASATIQISAGYESGADFLACPSGCGGLTAMFMAGTGTLSLTGSATPAAYQAVLRTLTFVNTSDDPSTATRTVTWIASDGAASSPPVTSSISVIAVNDPPLVTAGGTLSYTENDPATAIDTTVTVTDPDNANLSSATVQISANYQMGQDVLSFTNMLGITGSFVAGTGTLTLSGSSSVANYQTALRSVKYSNPSDNPSAAARTVQWIVSDGTDPSSAVTSTINVTPVNDPPVLTTNPIVYSTAGNTQLHVAGATLPGVVSIADPNSALDNAGATDVDGPMSPSVVPASGASGMGGSYSIAADGSFSYVPAVGFTGTDSFTYQVTDSVTPTMGTIQVMVSQKVWYVRDVVDANNPGSPDNDGRSTNAFDTLADAEANSDPNSIIFVFRGNTGTTALGGGIALKNGQRLWGEGIGLTLPVFGPLVPAGQKPHITNATPGGNGVTILANTANGNRTGVEVRGLDISGNVNAIDATSANTNSLGVTIGENTISGAGVEGIDINPDANSPAAATLSIHNNTITATGNGLDVSHSGTGTLTITTFNDNIVSGNTGGSGIVVAGPVTFDSTPGGALDPVPGGSTLIGTSGNGVGGAGMVMGGVTGDVNFDDLYIVADAGAALSFGGTGAFTGAVGTRLTVLSGGAGGSSTFVATGGPAVSVSDATIDLQPVSLSSTNSSTTGVSLVNVADRTVGPAFSAIFTAPIGSSITNATGTDFNIDSGNATVTYNGSITDTTGRLVSVTNTTGDSKSFTGAISDTGSGTGQGILLNSNTGSTISFSGGLTLSTGSNPAFAATGGGTVNATQNNGSIVNTLTTTTATALNVANTTIGGSGLTFRSVTAGTAGSGPTNGILLNNTGSSGGLSVTGDSGSSNNSSGGTIQHTVGAGISLSSTQSVSLDQMNIQSTGGSGVLGTSVTNFSFTNGTITGAGNANAESAIAFNGDPLGSSGSGNNINGTLTVTGNTITNPFYSGLDVQCDNGTVTNANVSNNTVTNPGFSGVNFVGDGSVSSAFSLNNATIAGNSISSSGGDGIQVVISNASASGPVAHAGFVTIDGLGRPVSDPNHIISITGNSVTLDTTGTQAIAVANGGGNSGARTQTNFEIKNNGTGANPLGSSSIGTVILIGNNGYSDMAGVVDNNVIVATHTPNLGGGNGIAGGNGVSGAGNAWTPRLFLSVTNNAVSGTDGNGILLVGRSTSGMFDLKIANNSVGAPVNAGGSARQGIRVDAGNASSADDEVFLNIFGNTSAGSNAAAGLGVRKQGTVSTTNDFGVYDAAGGPTLANSPTTAQVQTFINALNPAGNGTDIINGDNYQRDTTQAPP